MRRAPGYSLVELLLVVAVLGILVGVSSLSFSSFRRTGDLESSGQTLLGLLREAQSNALAQVDNEPWGVHFDDDRVVLYKGTTYAGTGTRILPLPKNISAGDFALLPSPGSTREVLFDKGVGTTANAGSVALIADTGRRTFQINSEGGMYVER